MAELICCGTAIYGGVGNYIDALGRSAPLSGPVLVPLWFVRDLMVVVVFTPFIHWLIRTFHFLPVLLFGMCYFTRLFIPVHGVSATCFFWFSLGAWFSIRGENMVVRLSRYRLPAIVVALLAIVPLVWYNGRKGDGLSPNPQWVHYLYYTYVVAAVLSLVGIAAGLLRQGRVKVHRGLARATFFIFLAHPFVLTYVGRVVNHFVRDTCYPLMILAYLFRPLMAVALCLLIYRLLERYMPRLLAVVTGGRVKRGA